MKIKSNLITLLSGAALGAVAVLSIAAVQQTETLSCGRFQLLATDNYIFKIDTATGQVWHSYMNPLSKEFMRPNLGAPTTVGTNSTSNLEKGAEK